MSNQVLNEDIQLIRRKDLSKLLTISLATLWRWESENRIPGRIDLGPGRVAYRKSVVLAWIESLVVD
jgi:predicted DNA-binding transcriptional regulator AlpA